jgi:hypothetical protein
MTWLSRLLPQSQNLQRLANQNHRFRQAQRRRRSMKLELLESRTLLSNVTTSMPTPSSPLTIMGDTSNDNFVVTENTNGTVTVAPGSLQIVPGIGVVPGSTINGISTSFTTSSAVSSIVVSLPGSTNFDFVKMTGPGTATTVQNVTVTATGAALNLTATGLKNSGNFVVSDTFTSPTNAKLTATVTGSSFATLSITQTGGGPDASTVTLGTDSVTSNVLVSEGNANGDKIILNPGNTFGMTTLLQGNGGPSNSVSLGNSDSVTVGSGTYRDLSIVQGLDGTKDNITVGPGVTISGINSSTPVVVDGVTVVPSGVWTKQGNGAGDVTTITGVTATPFQGQRPPAPIVFSNITVVQGNGSVGLGVLTSNINDVASVIGSSVMGNISITQSDLASNTPFYNMATISGDTAGGTISISQGDAGGTLIKGAPPTPGDQATVTGSKSGGSTKISQGMGSNDSATVSSSTVGAGITITQADVAANPAGDTALVMNDTVTGSVSITQGAASGDTATIDPTTISGDASITQGPGNGDSATISVTSVGGNVTITQGSGSGDTATVNTGSVGGNVTILQTDVAGNAAGDTATVVVTTVGGSVSITQGDASGDSATIDPATVGGSITIAQGAGNGDTALISGLTDTGGTDKAPIVISITQLGGNGDHATISNLIATGGTAATPIPIFISQGSGTGDFAELLNVNAVNSNVTITQTDVANALAVGDTAYVLNVVTGTSSGFDDFNGTVTITQGSAPGDVALVQDGTSNNVSITQGDSVQVQDGSTLHPDVAEVNRTSVFSNISIVQGTGSSNAIDAGNYVAAVAFDYLGIVVGTNPGVAGSGSVTAGGSTLINQQYANNLVFLGDTDDTFSTVFLDVFTGGGGGANVLVANTSVLFGPLGIFSFVYTIEGGGTGNTFYDLGGNFGVTADPANFNA